VTIAPIFGSPSQIFKSLKMSSETQSVLLALALVAASTYFIFRYYGRKSKSESVEDDDEGWPFPKLEPHGLFNYCWAKEAELDERKSDFCRIAWTMTDLLVATPEAPLPEVWKYPGFGKKEDSAHKEAAESMCKSLDNWLHEEVKLVGARTVPGLTERIVDLLSVSPAITFAIKHKIPLQILQARYMLLISKSAEIRVLWFAFITDKVKAGAKSGPFVLKLLSSNLNCEENEPVLIYSARRTKETQMCAIISKAAEQMQAGIRNDEWEALENL